MTTSITIHSDLLNDEVRHLLYSGPTNPVLIDCKYYCFLYYYFSELYVIDNEKYQMPRDNRDNLFC